MPADASIYGMIRPPQAGPGPLEQYSAMMQLRSMGDQQAVNALQMRKMKGDLDKEDAFQSRISDWVKAAGDTGNLPAEAYGVDATRAAQFDKARLDAAKSRGEMAKTSAATLAEQTKLWRDALATVRSNADLPALNERALAIWGPQLGPKLVPAQYDQAQIDAQIVTSEQRAGQLLKLAEPKFEWRSDGQTEKLYQTNPHSQGGVGLVKDAPVITKQMTPAEADAAKRGWAGVGLQRASLDETKRHNTASEGNAGVPPGYRRTADGKNLEPIPGGPATHLATEAAGRKALSEQGTKAVEAARKLFIGPDGSVDRVNIGSSGFQVPFTNISGIPYTEGRTARQQVRLGIEGALRIATGAAAPDAEVARYENMFLPSMGDTDADVKRKLDTLEDFLGNAGKYIDQGRQPGNSSPAAAGPSPAAPAKPAAADTNGFKVIRVEKRK